MTPKQLEIKKLKGELAAAASSGSGSSLSPAEERKLLAKARKGDRAALDRVATLLSGPAYRYGRFFCRNPHDAEDVMQDVLTSLARVVGEFEGRSSLSTWAYIVARNACARMRRRRVGQPETTSSLSVSVAEGGAGDIRDGSPDPAEETSRGQLRGALARAIVELTPQYREVIILRDVEGLPAEEAARVLGIQVRALKSRLHRARLELRGNLMAFADGGTPKAAGASDATRKGPGRCPDVAAMLSRYLEGDLDGSVCRQLEKHVGSCGACEDVCRSLKKSLVLCRTAGRDRAPGWMRSSLRQVLRRQVSAGAGGN